VNGTPSRDGVPFTELTALSFKSINDQLIAQTSKPIVDYGIWDVLEALEALACAWRRIRVDSDIEAFVTALRLRFGILMLTGSAVPRDAQTDTTGGDSTVAPGAGASSSSSSRPKSLADLGVFLGRVGRDAEHTSVGLNTNTHGDAGVSMLSFDCIIEASARFQTYSDIRAIARRCIVAWTPDAIRHLSLPYGGLSAVSGIDFAKRISSKYNVIKATRWLAETLLNYARDTGTTSSIADSYHQRLCESWVGPGDPMVAAVRTTGTMHSSKNIIRTLRGGRIATALYARSRALPSDVLGHTIERLDSLNENNNTSDQMRPRQYSPSASSQPPPQYALRSLMTSDEEFAALCSIHTLMRSRFGIDWTTWFLVTRGAYRGARLERDIESKTGLPVIIAAWNTCDVLYRGTILRTSSFIESLVWWLCILIEDHDCQIVVANISGTVGVMSREDAGGLPASETVVKDGALNVSAMPVSSAATLSFEELCQVVTAGPRSFVAKAGVSEKRMFVDERAHEDNSLSGDDSNDVTDATPDEQGGRRHFFSLVTL